MFAFSPSSKTAVQDVNARKHLNINICWIMLMQCNIIGHELELIKSIRTRQRQIRTSISLHKQVKGNKNLFVNILTRSEHNMNNAQAQNIRTLRKRIYKNVSNKPNLAETILFTVVKSGIGLHLISEVLQLKIQYLLKYCQLMVKSNLVYRR